MDDLVHALNAIELELPSSAILLDAARQGAALAED
jgi:hypothetical protein